MTDRSTAVAFVADRSRGVLATLKRDGRPQLSNVVYHCDADGRVRVSVTDDRAKTRNLRRDPRVSLHVTTPDFWPYVVVEGTAELSPVTTTPGDEASEALVDLYRAISGEHPDWDEYRQAMIDERRLALSFTVDHAYGIA